MQPYSGQNALPRNGCPAVHIPTAFPRSIQESRVTRCHAASDAISRPRGLHSASPFEGLMAAKIPIEGF